MEFMEREGRPFKGKELEQLKSFLNRMELEYDQGIEYSLCLLNEDDEILATGSVEQNVLKCIAVDENVQGQGLSGRILSNLIQFTFERGYTHLLMYTKPKNREMFEELGFYTVIMTKEVLFMENRKKGFLRFLNGLTEETPAEAFESGKVIGSIVANCNPFTMGHRYLMEQALTYCDYVHVLVLGDARTSFQAEERFFMVREGTRDLSRIIVHQVSDFVISAATFPTYFMKEEVQAKKANCRLDLELFGSRIGPALKITKRFVGTEPMCRITNHYNEEMKKILPEFGIQVKEIERECIHGEVISASAVRNLYDKKDFVHMKRMVPETTFHYLVNKKKVERPKG